MKNDVIRLLPYSVANQIAAGEVIQRPASVIKELVENAIDAGGTDISIILKDAGRTLIQVVDNGCGMSPTDARMAFERHATSKIASADDIYSLHTMGFRGEALASIAAVAQVDMRTMRHDDTIGTRLLISESKFESQEPATCVPGTNLMVKNIFFHMPARRKFLKKDSVELGHIMREFERLALVNTNVNFTLIHNEVTLHQFYASTLKQRIAALFGKSMESMLAPVATETSIVKIEGFIGMPRGARKRGYEQFLFVNGRNMRHPVFHKAVMKCYEQLIAPDCQPSYFINFDVDPATIDVNIHPQKHEIKFENEMAIAQILTAAIKETLGKTQAAGALDFDSLDAPEIPLFNPDDSVATPPESFDSDFNPFSPAADNDEESANAASRSYSSVHRTAPVPHDWDKLYESFQQKREDAYMNPPSIPAQEVLTQSLPSGPDESGFFTHDETEQAPAATCFQLQQRYIITQASSGVRIINQHRAHVRILFDRNMQWLENGEPSSQKLMFGEDFELSPAQNALLRATKSQFEAYGFGLRDNGKCKWSITAVPAILKGASPLEALQQILEDISTVENPDAVAFREPLALALARSMAVRPRQSLSLTEMETIIADLFRSSNPGFTPDGQTIMILIDNNDISRRFGQ